MSLIQLKYRNLRISETCLLKRSTGTLQEFSSNCSSIISGVQHIRGKDLENLLVRLEFVNLTTIMWGLCNVFRRFVKDFTKIASPLNVKLRKGQPDKLDKLSKEEMEVFEILKTKLALPHVLALPRCYGNMFVDTDACDRQVGCVLLQVQPD